MHYIFFVTFKYQYVRAGKTNLIVYPTAMQAKPAVQSKSRKKS